MTGPGAGSVLHLLAELAPVGRDPATGGYRRFAWTPADAAVRAWFTAAAHARDLDVRTDRNGNLWAWWGEPGRGAVGTGSHLDSVPDGGALDGPLGLAAAFAAVDELRARGRRPARPLAVVAFADEEGARFGLACVGSRLTAGTLDPDRALAARDREGVAMADAMRAAGVDPRGVGPEPELLDALTAFVELHVEQGRALALRDAPVGIATGIWPHGRWRLSVRGEANHAGTTRLADRRDPSLVLARAVLAARAAAERHDGLATIGRQQLLPNATNAVPAAAEGWLDARAPDEEGLAALLADVRAETEAEAGRGGVELTVTEESRTRVTTFDPALADRLGKALGEPPRLPTGAGHDAGVLAGRCPTAMLFVRNPTGVSHSPAEFAEPADCVTGARALAEALDVLLER